MNAFLLLFCVLVISLVAFNAYEAATESGSRYSVFRIWCSHGKTDRGPYEPRTIFFCTRTR